MNKYKFYKNGKISINNIEVTRHVNVSTKLIEETFLYLNQLKVKKHLFKKLKQIRFTYLKNNISGYYYQNCEVIHVCCQSKNPLDMAEVLIHELGHHNDFLNKISSDDEFVKEWKLRRNKFSKYHKDMRKDPAEYFAVGFEKYYLESKEFFKKHPILYKKIKQTLKTK